MKPLTCLSFLVASVLVLCLVGCKGERRADATKPLEQSFATATPEVQQAVASINAYLKAQNYTEATKALASLVTQRALTDAQRQALGVALQQINQAVAANPALDTREMYQLRAQLFRAFDHGPSQ
jgi:hypothetical protein